MRHVVLCISIICLSAVISPDESEAQWIRNGNPVKAGETNQYINDIMVDDGGALKRYHPCSVGMLVSLVPNMIRVEVFTM